MKALAFKFTRAHRLLTKADIDACFKASICVKNSHITLITRPNQRPVPRLGFILPKKKIKRAVDRNRTRRITRESVRLAQATLQGIDIVVMARHGLGELSKAQLRADLDKLWIKLSKRYEASHLR